MNQALLRPFPSLTYVYYTRPMATTEKPTKRFRTAQRLLTIADLAVLLSVPRSTVYGWRSQGIGPPSIKIGGHVRYRRADIDRWMIENIEP